MKVVWALARPIGVAYFNVMSFAEILDEIPRLTLPERRELFLQVLSLESDVDELALCDHVAMEGFAMLEEMEAADDASG